MNYFYNCLLLLLSTLIHGLSNDTIPITTHSIITPNSHLVWFTQTQVFVYQASSSPPYNLSEFIHHYTDNTPTQPNTISFSSKNWINMQMAKMPLTSDYMIGSINSNNELIFYQISNNSLIEWYNPSVTSSRVVLSQQDPNYAFSINSTTCQLLKINLRSKTVQQNINIFSSLYQIQQIAYDGGIVAGYSRFLVNNSIPVYFYNFNLNSVHLLTIPWSVQPSLKSFKFSSAKNILIVSDTNQVQIWNIQNNSIIATILNNVTVNWGFEDAIICNGLIFIFSNKFLNVYELANLTLFQSIDLMEIYWVSMTKCYSDQNKVAAYLHNSNQKLVKYFIFNYTNSTSQTTNNINSGTSQNSSPTTASQLQNLSHSIRSAVISPQAKVIGGITSSVAGLTSATAILKPIMQPFTCFIQDLWFYGFHQFTYPEFVQLFTKEIDILNQLRIKPQFIHFQIQFSNLESLNARQVDMKLLQDKAPDSQYMLQATKDIYTINLATSLVSFVVIKLICQLFKSTKRFCLIIEKAYRFLSPICKFWSLAIAFFQSNITPIVFYASLQFNSFVCFDQLSKFNLVITLLIFFVVQAYAFLFYPLLFQFANRQTRKKVSDFGKEAHHSYWLEMCLKCLRSYFQSLVHGLFINKNVLQLFGLIISDLFFVIALVCLRRMFQSKTVFLSTTFYFAFFLVFDVTLIIYRLLSSLQISETQRREWKIYIEFVTMIVIVFMLAISMIRVLIPICSFIYDNIAQRIKRKNLISDQNAKKLKTKNVKDKQKSQNNIFLKKKHQGQKQQKQKKDDRNAKIAKSTTKIKDHCKRTRVGMQIMWVGSKREDKNQVVS